MGAHWECKDCGKYNIKPFFGNRVCKWCGVMQGQKQLVALKMQETTPQHTQKQTQELGEHQQDGCYLCEILDAIHHNQLILYDRSERMEVILQNLERHLLREPEEQPQIPSVEEYKQTKKAGIRGRSV